MLLPHVIHQLGRGHVDEELGAEELQAFLLGVLLLVKELLHIELREEVLYFRKLLCRVLHVLLLSKCLLVGQPRQTLHH